VSPLILSTILIIHTYKKAVKSGPPVSFSSFHQKVKKKKKKKHNQGKTKKGKVKNLAEAYTSAPIQELHNFHLLWLLSIKLIQWPFSRLLAHPCPVQEPQNRLHSLLLIEQLRDWFPAEPPPPRPDVLLDLPSEHPDMILLVHAVLKQMLPCLSNVIFVPPTGVRV
jgi:hypothetical protein